EPLVMARPLTMGNPAVNANDKRADLKDVPPGDGAMLMGSESLHIPDEFAKQQSGRSCVS
ncbi:MAG TPA: hypothetical protein VGQ35_15850, partial [Dongiaceae bacterium]|nr:hypothetical protein [Dongiaceae bacterium]